MIGQFLKAFGRLILAPVRWTGKRLASFASADESAVPSEELPSQPTSFSEKELKKIAMTDTILIDPSILARFFDHAARHPRNEVGALLLGRTRGRFLQITDLARAEKIGTATRIDFTPRDFERAQELAKEGESIIGWMHSHPTYGAFMSATDARFQGQGQTFSPDYVALVLDPFRPDGAQFRFYRVQNGEARQVPHHYWRSESATQAPNPDT